MLKLHNIRMEPSNVRKKIKEPPNVTKIQSYVMFVLYNMRMEPSNVIKKKKKKRTTNCDKSNVKCDIRTVQCEDETVKCEKKI